MGRSSARDRLEQALDRIADPNGEGVRACLTVYADVARAAADAADARSRHGVSLGALDGAIVSIKDLFDVAGEVTRAGSRVVAEEGKPAAADAPVVRRLRAAGCVIVAKTNMTEFAFSGVGANPHFGTPGNPFDRSRVPGGSTAGAFPLSCTLDSIGPMAKSAAECAAADAVMAGEEPWQIAPPSPTGLRLGVLQGMPFDGIDPTVSAALSDALTRLGRAGARVSDEIISLIADMTAVNAKGGFAPPEAYAIHRERLKRRGADIDPNVRARIERGGAMSAADYVESAQARAELIRAMDLRLAELDALLLPTTSIVAPKLAEVATPETFGRNNMMLLRNTAMVNFFDLCAISLPLPRAGGPAVGLMLVARNGADRRLFNVAAAVEKLLAS